MRAMVLAAGLGTRLRPLTLERPKPGVPYGLRPLACIALDALAEAGVRKIVMNTHHLGEALPGLLAPHLPPGVEIEYVHEPQLLGTGGGIHNVREFLLADGGPVFIMNSDIVFQPDLKGALGLHRRLNAVATMVLRPDPNAAQFGAVEVDGEGHVRRLLGKPQVEEPLETYMFTGVHVLSARAFEDVPPDGCIVQHAYRRWVDEGTTVAGFVDPAAWQDLGTHARYLDAHIALTEGGSLIHPSANVDPAATIVESVVGEGARVGPVRVSRSVVWPGANVHRDVHQAIVTPKEVVPV
ncbi:MAG: NDP-sugar synthase [Myxococcota bacterium]